MFRTCGNYTPPVFFTYGLQNPNWLFPANMTGQPFDNRIDCGPLTTKNTWEIVVTGTIPLDPITG